MPAPIVKISYNGGKVRLIGGFGTGLASFKKFQLLRINAAGLDDLKKRVGNAQGSNDERMKPLNKGYAIYKSKSGKGNLRNLTFSGDMLRNLTLRSASDNEVRSALTQRLQRTKGLVNEKIQSWIKWSPKNQRVMVELATRVFKTEVVPEFANRFFKAIRK